MCLIPCFAGTAWAGWKVNKGLDNTFNSAPQEPVENVLVTEAKLNLRVGHVAGTRGHCCCLQGSRLPGGSCFAPATDFVSCFMQLASIKPRTTGPEEKGPPARKVTKKEAASKARLQGLIDKHAPSKKRA